MTRIFRATAFFLFPAGILVLCLVFPHACARGVSKGLTLSLSSALPSLFPALVCSRMITRALSPKMHRRAVFLPFLLGLLCGFPVGAQSTSELVEKGVITKKDGEKLLFFVNNAGPAFLIGFCGANVLGDPSLGFFLFFLQSILSGLCFFFFFGKKRMKSTKQTENKEEQNCFFSSQGNSFSPTKLSFSALFTQALGGAMHSFLYIMSCILFFSFLEEVIFSFAFLSDFSETLLALFLEMTSGIRRLSDLPHSLSLSLCALGCGWGGLSVHFQTLGETEKASLSPKFYFLGKLLFAGVMFLGAEIFQKYLS